MYSNIVIVIMVQFLLVCAPLNRQASALDRGKDPEQLWNLGWELSQECLTHRDTIRVKGNRHAGSRGRGRIPTIHPQSDLLQELLTTEVIRHEPNQMTEKINKMQKNGYKNTEQVTGLLEELLVIPIPNQSAIFVGSSSAPQHTDCMPSSPQSSPP